MIECATDMETKTNERGRKRASDYKINGVILT